MPCSFRFSRQLTLPAVPRDASFNVDATAVISKINELGRCIVYLASPNNPTGNCLRKEDFLRISATDCVIVLDEAYAEFSQASLYDAAAPVDNVIFCRTFSKWAALAGMRVGYCIAHSTFVRTMMAIKQPYNIPVSSESAALAALSARAEIMKQVLAIVDERESMVLQVTTLLSSYSFVKVQLQLKQFPFLQAFPSSANFVLFRVVSFPAQDVALALRSRGILVRIREVETTIE
jgi:histidinol-phosphate aminotransferase